MARRPHILPGLALLTALSWIGCSDLNPLGTGGGGAGGTGGTGGVPGSGASSSGPTAPSSGTMSGPLPFEFTVEGIVVDEAGIPVEGAIVLQGGGEIQSETDDAGHFTLNLTQAIAGTPTAVAAKVGFRSAGLEFISEADLAAAPIELMITRINAPDNTTTYTFGNPGSGHEAGNTTQCAHCHTTIAKQFETSAHDRSTRNPKLQDLYAGVATNRSTAEECAAAGGVMRTGTEPGQPGVALERCYLGAGVLDDLNGCGVGQACDDPSLPAAQKPTAFGACADCHSIGMDGPLGGRDLLEAEGYAFERGNHCDACHHVRDIDLEQPPGVGGRLVMQRPRETNSDAVGAPLMQAIFGPYPDVPTPFMGGSYQPKYSTSEYCAGCHEHTQGALLPGAELDPRFAEGVPIHSTFSEWSEGPFNPGSQCQTCHMPPIESLFNAIDSADETNAGIVFGFPRKANALRSHVFRGPLAAGPGEPRLIDSAANLAVEVVQENEQDLLVLVDAANIGAGHAIPTGDPMRAIFLTVDVAGCGKQFRATGGLTIPAFGGTSRVGAVGTDLTEDGVTLNWPAFTNAAPGMVLRAVRPTAEHWDYDGVGLFEGLTLPPEEKGLPVLEPLGESPITAVDGSTLTLFRDLKLEPGDLVYLIDEPLPPLDGEDGAGGSGGGATGGSGGGGSHGGGTGGSHGGGGSNGPGDGAPSGSLAGLPGTVYARVLSDASGEAQVPQHLATTILSDSRIRPQTVQSSVHRFIHPSFCHEATVTARLLYRPHPWKLARERRWDGRDYVIAEALLSLDLLPPEEH